MLRDPRVRSFYDRIRGGGRGGRPVVPDPDDPRWSGHRTFPGGPVLVVGDSHTWMAGAGSQFPAWDVDCHAGRSIAQAIDVVAAELAERHRVVVFDIATNDVAMSSELHWRELVRLREVVGPRRLVLVTSWRLDLSLEHVVANQRRLAMEDPQTSVADWADFAAHHPHLFIEDGLHFTDAALLARNAIVWAGVRAAELELAAGGPRSRM